MFLDSDHQFATQEQGPCKNTTLMQHGQAGPGGRTIPYHLGMALEPQYVCTA